MRIVWPVVALPIALSACAGGGGGTPPTPSPTPTPTPTSTTLLYGPAAAATYGANTAVQLAAPGGPTADGSNGIFPANGTQFAVLQTALLYTIPSSGGPSVAADTTANADGAYLTFNSGAYTPMTATVTSNLGLTESGVGTVVAAGSAAALEQPTANVLNQSFQALDYLYYGAWYVETPNSASNGDFQEPQYRDIGAAIAGYVTPTSAMPTSGSATYQGLTTGYVVGGPFAARSHGSVNNITTNEYTATLSGTASLTVNFASGSVSGNLTDMTASTYPLQGTLTNNPSFAWNNVSLTGSVSGNTISDTTAAASAPGLTYSLPITATGTLKGGFYGPTAQTVGAVWTLAAPDGSGSAIGAIGAPKAPSDRRLKRDIELAYIRADGLRIYSLRYATNPRRFIGVMAQDLEANPNFASAVSTMHSGLMVVDYRQIGLDVRDLAAMRAAGIGAMAAYANAHSAPAENAAR